MCKRCVCAVSPLLHNLKVVSVIINWVNTGDDEEMMGLGKGF